MNRPLVLIVKKRVSDLSHLLKEVILEVTLRRNGSELKDCTGSCILCQCFSTIIIIPILQVSLYKVKTRFNKNIPFFKGTHVPKKIRTKTHAEYPR